MKDCIKCGNPLRDDATHCPACDTNHISFFDDFEPQPAHSTTFLKVLCILTIIGAFLGLARSIFAAVDETSMFIAGFEVVIYLSIVVAIGKLTGAIFMLLKKLKGLYIYTFAAILAIINQIYSAYISSGYIESLSGNNSAMDMISIGVVIVFFLAFLIMYWLPVNRRLLS